MVDFRCLSKLASPPVFPVSRSSLLEFSSYVLDLESGRIALSQIRVVSSEGTNTLGRHVEKDHTRGTTFAQISEGTQPDVVLVEPFPPVSGR